MYGSDWWLSVRPYPPHLFGNNECKMLPTLVVGICSSLNLFMSIDRHRWWCERIRKSRFQSAGRRVGSRGFRSIANWASTGMWIQSAMWHESVWTWSRVVLYGVIGVIIAEQYTNYRNWFLWQRLKIMAKTKLMMMQLWGSHSHCFGNKCVLLHSDMKS